MRGSELYLKFEILAGQPVFLCPVSDFVFESHYLTGFYLPTEAASDHTNCIVNSVYIVVSCVCAPYCEVFQISCEIRSMLQVVCVFCTILCTLSYVDLKTLAHKPSHFL